MKKTARAQFDEQPDVPEPQPVFGALLAFALPLLFVLLFAAGFLPPFFVVDFAMMNSVRQSLVLVDPCLRDPTPTG